MYLSRDKAQVNCSLRRRKTMSLEIVCIDKERHWWKYSKMRNYIPRALYEFSKRFSPKWQCQDGLPLQKTTLSLVHKSSFSLITSPPSQYRPCIVTFDHRTITSIPIDSGSPFSSPVS